MMFLQCDMLRIINAIGKGNMEIIEIENRIDSLIAELTYVWEKSVKATHLFISLKEINNIKQCIPDALRQVDHLAMAKNENGTPVAFMGTEAQRLGMLFVLPEERGKGLGGRLLQFGIESYQINELTVNEQNPIAKNFYEHMGFKVYKRTDLDEQGRPYPLLYMRLR